MSTKVAHKSVWGTRGSKQRIEKKKILSKSAKDQISKSCNEEKKCPYHVEFFIAFWIHLSRIHTNREHFALTWMWREPEALQIFVNRILEMDCKPSRSLLKMGYSKCRTDYFDAFSITDWEKIDEVFLDKRNPSVLPSSLRNHMAALATLDCQSLLELCDERQKKLDHGRSYSQQSFEVKPLPIEDLVALIGYFFGDWNEDMLAVAASRGYFLEGDKRCNPELPPLKHMPTYCHLYCERSHNMTYFFAKDQDGEVDIVAIHIFHTYLSFAAREYIRKLLIELFEGHPIIRRASCLTYDSHMTGFGPFSKRYEKNGGMKVSFYTAVEKLHKKFKTFTTCEQFQELVDRYAHCHLTSIIFALFVELCPSVLPDFLNFSSPYLRKGDYEPCDLETYLNHTEPSAYQMYITKNFCSEIHQDADATDFTICYASHPDAQSTSKIRFMLAKYNLVLDIGDSDIFAFRSREAHGTPYRPHTRNATYVGCNATYVGCVAVNNRLQQLAKRRARARLSST